MRVAAFLVVAFCLFNLFACTRNSAQEKGYGKTIRAWENDGRYWAWDGTEPTLLLGAGSDDNLFQRGDYRGEMGTLRDAGGNFVRCVLHSRGERDAQPYARDTATGQFILDRPNSLYWAKLADFLRAASDHNHVVQMEGWAGQHYKDQVNAMSLESSLIEQLRKISDAHSNILYANDSSLPATSRSHRHTQGSFGNGRIFEETSKAQYGIERQDHWAYLLAGSSQDSLPKNAAALTGHGPNPNVVDGTAQFNRALLAGHAAVRHAREPIGSGINSSALSSIRAIRNIEQDFKFWDLTPAPEIIVGPPGEVYAAKDEAGNYLVYLAGPGSVTVRLATDDQPTIRVSVVGYLGTRRSEVLEPPYGSTFSISTEDDRGAWLLMKRVE